MDMRPVYLRRLRGVLLFETARGWSVARLRNFRASGAFAGSPAFVPGWLVIADTSGNATRIRLHRARGKFAEAMGR